MRYQVYDLGQLKRGDRVQVVLSGNAANVRLMDTSNYNNYKNARRHSYYGGLATKSPIILGVPYSGHWYVTVDLQGLRGTVRSSVRVLPGALPQYHEPALSSVPSLYQGNSNDYNDSENIYKEYDVFISHASEDKDDVVRPLAYELQRNGLKVWYDEFEMKIGDSLRRKIDKGLANSKFGVVVLSKDFIKKGWTNYELDGIITKATTGEQIILPIWHNITKKEVIDFSPSLADKLARNTATFTIDEIAAEITEVIKSHNQ
ncbi:DUF1883 domain-containing protein [Alistipes communis]|jgi:hypothetical protein|uniref:DUF1883 domain-containing protein n=1 Tax=Alistipes communis TaxID=2585118 RepID=UPI003077E1B4